MATGECGRGAENHCDKAGMDSGPVGPRPYTIGGGSSLKIQNTNYKYKGGKHTLRTYYREGFGEEKENPMNLTQVSQYY